MLVRFEANNHEVKPKGKQWANLRIHKICVEITITNAITYQPAAKTQ
jgi:hypothetical protein